MLVDNFLACPLDGLPLAIKDRQLCCSNGHTFDIARQGYVNLLPVQNKRSRDPGDSKDMVLARQAFLNEGWYQTLAKKVTALLCRSLRSGQTLLDAGCGEGYYLDYVAEHGQQGLNCVGNDISKHAIIKACQRNRQHTWLVASNKNLPVQSQSVDALMSLFGFPVFDEFKRVLKQDGVLLLVDAAENHLCELREILYPSLKQKTDKVTSAAQESGFQLLSEERLQFALSGVGQQHLQSLMLMTPHFFRAKAEGREQAMKLASLDVTADIRLRLFKKE